MSSLQTRGGSVVYHRIVNLARLWTSAPTASVFTSHSASTGRCRPRPLGSSLCQAGPLGVRQVRTRSGGAGLDGDREAEYAEARRWSAGFSKDTIPRNLARVRYDRSSGKGGQHVNTTSSKATVAWQLDTILAYVPKIFHAALRSSRYYVASSDSLQMSAQSSRSQHDNEDECYEKFYELLSDISRRVIPGETSPEQKAKVERMQKAENTARLQMKKRQSTKKQARRGGGRIDY